MPEEKETPLDLLWDLTWTDFEGRGGKPPEAYLEARKYLRKASKVMTRQKRQKERNNYLLELRKTHFRKRRLMEVLDDLESERILKKKG